MVGQVAKNDKLHEMLLLHAATLVMRCDDVARCIMRCLKCSASLFCAQERPGAAFHFAESNGEWIPALDPGTLAFLCLPVGLWGIYIGDPGSQ